MITEELIEQAKKFVHPERKVVGLGQLVSELRLTWREALDLRAEMARRGLVVIPEPRKTNYLMSGGTSSNEIEVPPENETVPSWGTDDAKGEGTACAPGGLAKANRNIKSTKRSHGEKEG